MVDFHDSAEDAAFRAAVSTWLDGALADVPPQDDLGQAERSVQLCAVETEHRMTGDAVLGRRGEHPLRHQSRDVVLDAVRQRATGAVLWRGVSGEQHQGRQAGEQTAKPHPRKPSHAPVPKSRRP